MPPASPLPEIAEPSRSAALPRTLSVKAATALIGRDNAVCAEASGPVSPQAYRLDAAHSLVLMPHPCGNGAYNAFTSVYVLDERGRATPATYDVSVGMGEAGDNDLVNAAWDTKDRRLRDFEKGRGLGDCGITHDFAWDGTRFRLTLQTEMTECRAAISYIPTWRARVVGL